jgi:hypothetical protein
MTAADSTARPGLARVLALLLGLVAVAARAEASTTLDFVTFDGVAYIRWQDEPGRNLTSDDLGIEFGTVQCSLGEDVRGCPYGVDGGAAFLPAGTRMHAVRGHPTEFRLAAVWRDRIFLYQAWRNPRAKVGGELYGLAGKVRAIDVRRETPAPGGYWLTFWLTDGTTLGRPFFVETRELMGGVSAPEEFRTLLERHLAD